MSGSRWPVVIVGAGLAGLACAIRLAERGVPVRVLESRQRPGGRATSHVDPHDGSLIDNCQHVAMGCCHRYLALCDTLGVLNAFEWTSDQTWIEAGGRRSRIGRGPLPAPFHFAGAFLRARFLSIHAKRNIAIGLAHIAATTYRAWRGRTFGEFLDASNQGPEERTRFWSPVIVSACNLSIDRVDASLSLRVFREGFLSSRASASVGVPRVPLASLYDNAATIIARAGGELSLSMSVARIHSDRVECADGQIVRGRAIVVALPPDRCAVAVDGAAQDERFACFARLEHSPILGVHLWLDRVALDVPHAVLIGDGVGVQWLFRKRYDAGSSIQRLHAVVSAADSWMGQSEDAIVARVQADLATCLGTEAVVARAIAIRERRATFAATPAFELTRPGTVGSGPILLAGDYVATGWPATMEGAVRSGEAAATAALMRCSG